jgi:hypothetical protein
MTQTVPPPADIGFDFIDAIPDAGNPTQTDTLYCQVCGTEIPYAGRGRKPLYCEEHKPASHKAKTSTGNNATIVNRAIGELTMLYGLAGVGIRYVDPIAGMIVTENRDKLAESYRMLLETNAKIRKLFTEIEGKAAWLPILVVHGDVIAAIMLARAARKSVQEGEPEPEPALFGLRAVPDPGMASGV